MVLPARTALDGAVFPVPAGDAEASAVLALAVLVAAGIAQLRVAELASPAVVACAQLAHTDAMLTALQIAQLWNGMRESKRDWNKVFDLLRMTRRLLHSQSSI